MEQSPHMFAIAISLIVGTVAILQSIKGFRRLQSSKRTPSSVAAINSGFGGYLFYSFSMLFGLGFLALALLFATHSHIHIP